jgi:coenzyme F420 hydrogenase subunit beta
VVDTGLCTGCSGCIVACPHDVLGYDDFLPVQQAQGMDVDQCSHGDNGCDVCTRACPRFRIWEPEFDQALHGRGRRPDEVAGIAREVVSVWANSGAVHASGQDGGFITSALLWGLQTGRIDAAVLSRPSEVRPFDSEPFLAITAQDVLDCAGSVYTYSAGPLVLQEAASRGLESVALVGMGCQASINGAVRARGLGKLAARIGITIGLFCSKTFTYEGQAEVLARRGIAMDEVIKVDVKGRFLAWTRDGRRVEIPLKEMHPHTREGCRLCPDFAAEHADISAGGIGADGWTLVAVRTQRGQDWMRGLERDGVIVTRSGEDDPAGMALLTRLSAKSRRRWPDHLPREHASPGLTSDSESTARDRPGRASSPGPPSGCRPVPWADL